MLTAVMAATLLPVQVYADITEPVLVVPPPNERSIDEPITADESEAALKVVAEDNKEIKVDAKDVTNINATGDGVSIESLSGGKTDVYVDGNINAGLNGLYAASGTDSTNTVNVDGDVHGGVMGIFAQYEQKELGLNEHVGGTSDITVIGNVSGGYDGVFTDSRDANINRISVIGGVESTADSMGHGVLSIAQQGGQSEIYVRDDVSAHGKDGYGVGSYVHEGGKSWVIVKGDIVADGANSGLRNDRIPDYEHSDLQKDLNTEGIHIHSDGKAENVVRVGGDVNSSGVGLKIDSKDENSVNIVTVEGTISGKECGVVVEKEQVGYSEITVWKIEQNAEGAVAATESTDANGKLVYTENEELEKQIRYIIKVDKPGSGARLSATDGNGNPLAHIDGIDGNRLQYATEGEKVLLRIDLMDGYSIEGVYGDEGRSVELTKDENGNYYILVPKGGGVYLSVKLSKDRAGDEHERDIKGPADRAVIYYPSPNLTTTDFTAVRTIIDAPENGTILLAGMVGGALSVTVTQALLSRPDLTVEVTYYINGVLYRVVIPAGADLTELLNASGGIDFVTLGAAFNGQPVR